MASKIGAQVIAFINEKIFRRPKESSILLVQIVATGGAFAKQIIRSALKRPLKLQPPNDTIGFPLTNRWSNPNPALSQQALYMVVKQLELNAKSSGKEQKTLIDSQKDRSKQCIKVMDLLHTYNIHEMTTIERVIKQFGQFSSPLYNFERESIFAESHINGQHSFNLRKFDNNPQYDLAQSKSIQQSYLAAIKKAFDEEKINHQNLKQVGLTLEQLKNRIFTTGEGVYSMLFQHLERLSGGKVLQNRPTIYLGNNQIKDTYYLQAPYPIYVKVKNPKTQQQTFICAAIGFRYEGGNIVKIFSPFFSSQQEKVWRLAQNHLGQAIFNDFHIRVHLGVYHFTTNQYNVPIYNYINKLRNQECQNYRDFLTNTYSLFNRGLEGVNVAATATLVHPLDKYSLINTVFNYSQTNAINLYSSYSSRLDLTKYSPREITQSRGITKELAEKDLDRLSFDIKLYPIISKYIENVYNLFQIDGLANGLKDEVNSELKNMILKNQQTERPGVQSKEDVLKLLKNLMYCWVGYHTHTFSTPVLANYWLLRPSMLKKKIHYDSSDWSNIVIGQQIPDSKILMEAGKLTEATTQRDTSNEVLGILKEQAFKATLIKQQTLYTNKAKSARYQKLVDIINETISQLEAYGQEIEKVNKRRQESIPFTWMNPQRMQTSLNI